MDTQALVMAIYMGLYVPLFTGISVAVHRFIRPTPQQSNKIIIVHRQFKNQTFDDANINSIFKLEKSPIFPFTTDIMSTKKLNFYKFLPPAYTIDKNLLQKFEFQNIVIVESKINLKQLPHDR